MKKVEQFMHSLARDYDNNFFLIIFVYEQIINRQEK